MHEARTTAEREAIYRLRYAVYVRELKKAKLAGVDHSKEELRDPEDERDTSLLLYTGTCAQASSTLRADVYPPGSMPEALQSRYRLELFPELRGRSVVEICRFIVAPGRRRSWVATSIAIGMYRALIARGVSAGFSYAAPGLVATYARFGFRPYAATLIHTSDGIRVPLMAITLDRDFLQRAKSPLAGLVDATLHARTNDFIDPALLANRILAHGAPFDANPATVLSALRQLCKAGSRVFEGIHPAALPHIAAFAALVTVEAGAQVLRAGLVDREVFVVLSGRLAAVRQGVKIRQIGPGEPIGEVALFAESGERSADVYAEDQASLLMLRRRVVEELMKHHPAVGGRLVLNLARIMAERVRRP